MVGSRVRPRTGTLSETWEAVGVHQKRARGRPSSAGALDALRDVASKVPADRLLVETDSPYLAPIPYRGKPNLPEYVRDVADYLAMLRGESYERFAE